MPNKRNAWPTLKSYTDDELRKISMPVGGIGTGDIGLGGNGGLVNWEIMNRPSFKESPDVSAFLIRVEQKNRPLFAKVLEGPLDSSLYEGPFGAEARNHGMPRFRKATFKSAYPFGQVLLEDAKCPVSVTLQSFNPLIPSDAAASSYPIMVFRCVIENSSDDIATVSIASNLSNFIRPFDLQNSSHVNHNEYIENQDFSAIRYSAEMSDIADENYGNFSIALVNPQNLTHRTSWADLTWRDSLLDMWDDFLEDGSFDQRKSTNFAPTGSLCDKRIINPGESEEFTFLISWYFPNRRAWSIEGEDGTSPPGTNIGKYSDLIIGNFYATQFEDSIDVLKKFVPEMQSLENRTLKFVEEVLHTGFPESLIDSALSNLSTLKTQTIFQSSDGKYFGWEGIGYNAGSCFGNCSHVWNYEQTTAFLFSNIAKDFRETEFNFATNRDGFMSFRVTFPLDGLQAWPIAAADGQMGCIVKLYREWMLSGDTEWLLGLWPAARRALEFAWIPGGWDANQDGVMEGVQHNTMDVEYYGPNPQMGFWYLAALRAAEEMALELGENDFAIKCRGLFENGSKWIDANLFNGFYYEHKIYPLLENQTIAPGLRHGVTGAQDTSDPELQLGSGCLVDQLIGQFLADITDLGPLADPENIRTAAGSILKFNEQVDLFDHFNHMRSYALGDERGLLMATYPVGNRPKRPFPYFTEMMTAYEYTAAGNLIYSGELDKGINVISNVRGRFAGKTRNPFDEAECGRHYSRAMIAWGLFLAWTGQKYSAKRKTLTFRKNLENSTLPWFTGASWGTATQVGDEMIIDIIEGKVNIDFIQFKGVTYTKVLASESTDSTSVRYSRI
jgi:non-lysosomal glucosylceramidase